MGTISENVAAFQSPGGLQSGKVNPSVVASTTAMPKPTSLVTFVSGTVAITTWALPWPGFTGTIKIIPTGVFTGATGGVASATALPIAIAFSAVVSKVLDLVTDGNLWYPSYLS